MAEKVITRKTWEESEIRDGHSSLWTNRLEEYLHYVWVYESKNHDSENSGEGTLKRDESRETGRERE